MAKRFPPQLNRNYILNYLQLPETISKLEINFLGAGPSRSAVKRSILRPRTCCFSCTQESSREAEPEVHCHMTEQLSAESQGHIFTASQINSFVLFVLFRAIFLKYSVFFFFFWRASECFILDFSGTISMLPVWSSSI